MANMNQNFVKPTTSASIRTNSVDISCRRWKGQIIESQSNIDYIEMKRGKFSMLPRNNKWMSWNISLPKWEPGVYQKFYGKNVGKVGPSFEKLKDREFKVYWNDLSYPNSYATKYIAKGLDISKSSLRKQFLDKDDPRLKVTLKERK